MHLFKQVKGINAFHYRHLSVASSFASHSMETTGS